jgi:hypothetical protein
VNRTMLLALTGFGVVIIPMGVLDLAEGPLLTSAGYSNRAQQKDVADRESEPLDQEQRNLRHAKDARYNSGGPDLTLSKQGTDHFFEHSWPRVGFISVAESALVVTGRVEGMQSFMSEDRSRIYTEIVVSVEEVFKSDLEAQISAHMMLVGDRVGGTFETESGQVIRDRTSIEGLGNTRLGGRYVLFFKKIHKGMDLSMVRGYELRDRKVFKLTDDGSPGSVLLSAEPGIPDSFSDEQSFLDIIRKRTAEHTSSK